MSQADVAARNRAFILDYFDRVLNRHDASAIPVSHAADYRQHSPNIPDGVAGLVSAYGAFIGEHPRASAEVKRVIAEGDLVAIHSHCRFGPEHRGAAVVDIFRVEDGKILEHWDVVQMIPEEALHDNGMF